MLVSPHVLGSGSLDFATMETIHSKYPLVTLWCFQKFHIKRNKLQVIFVHTEIYHLGILWIRFLTFHHQTLLTILWSL